MTRPTWVMHSSAVIVVLAIVLTAPPGSAQQPPSSPSGLTVHPDNGELWHTDNGPQGGDEINIIKRGLNYGWPVVTYGRAYTTDPDGIRSGLPPPNVQPPTSAPGMEEPTPATSFRSGKGIYW